MKATPAGRNRARRFAVQAIYQAQMTGDDLMKVYRQFREDNDMKRVDTQYLKEVMTYASGLQNRF